MNANVTQGEMAWTEAFRSCRIDLSARKEKNREFAVFEHHDTVHTTAAKSMSGKPVIGNVSAIGLQTCQAPGLSLTDEHLHGLRAWLETGHSGVDRLKNGRHHRGAVDLQAVVIQYLVGGASGKNRRNDLLQGFKGLQNGDVNDFLKQR